MVEERNLTSLKGTAPIRLRPSVVLGSDGIRGVQQTLFEIITNSIDRWKDGYGDKIIVTRHKDDSYTIQDFADGLPYLWNKEEQAYNWDLALCKLYGGDNYKQSEKLTGKLGNFGLGLCSSQFSSEYMNVVIRKEKEKVTLKFKEGRVVDKDTNEFIKPDDDNRCTKEQGLLVMDIKNNTDGFTGTTINYKPDDRVFTDIHVSSEWIKNKLQKQAMINNGIKIIFNDELENKNYEYYYQGVKDYLNDIIKNGYISDFISFKNEAEGQDKKDKPVYKMNYEITFAFNNEIQLQQYYHNSSELTELNLNVTTKAVEKALTSAIHKYADNNNLYKKGEKIKFTDISDSLICILKSKSTRTSYANQTKLSIDNKFIKDYISSDLEEQFYIYLDENKFESQKIVNQVLINMRANDKASKSKLAIKKKLTEKINIFSKIEGLYEAEESDANKRILCICEGKSALSSLLSGKRDIHAIFPLRGKILNCLKASPEAIFKNEVILKLMRALNCGIEFKDKANKEFSTFNMDNLRYHDIYIMVDADVDGIGSIFPLLLTMFYKLTPTLIKEGRIHICETPKYEIDYDDKEEYFAINDEELIEIKKQLDYDNNKNKITINYIKGLSELSSHAMELCLEEGYKNIKTITIEDFEKAKDTIELFMDSVVEPRKEYILSNYDKIGLIED